MPLQYAGSGRKVLQDIVFNRAVGDEYPAALYLSSFSRICVDAKK